jgi:dihydrofolate reductase
MREWAQKLAIPALKAKTERGVLVGAPRLAAALEELELIDEYRIVVHPVISGRGPTLFHGLSSARHLELLATQRFKSGVQALHFRRKAG